MPIVRSRQRRKNFWLFTPFHPGKLAKYPCFSRKNRENEVYSQPIVYSLSYKRPEETEDVVDKDGWLHSGDLGKVDEEGYYRITGRLKDMIIRGGENIYPREIEEFLFTIKEIKDVQVVGIPDQKWGEIAVAFIILKRGQMIMKDNIRDIMINSVARYKIPAHFFFLAEFPMTASGKIQKYKLREMAEQILGEEADK